MTTTTVLDLEGKRASASKRISATPDIIFELLADPSKHHLFDGSGMVQSASSQRLELGSKFAMSMKLSLLPYRVGNTVVEFVENELIAWQHFGKHRWRYELEPIDDTTTLVTETFDWSTSIIAPALVAAGYPKRNLAFIEQTLERLSDYLDSQ